MGKLIQTEFVQWMGPLLDALRELGDSATPAEASDLIAKNCNVPDKKKEALLPSGSPRFHNQVCWARQYLVWEGLVSSAKRGIWTLTDAGRKAHLTTEQGHGIFKKWCAIHAQKRKAKQGDSKGQSAPADASVASDAGSADDEVPQQPHLLRILQKMTPYGFERFCKYLLRVYGFERVEVTPVGKDGGIDGYGVMQLNPFVSFRVVFQCKRVQKTVSRAQVGDLRNAMIGRADKGIMITTGIFSEDAKREACRDGAPPIELIDGSTLITLLEREEIGVTKEVAYTVDPEFFRQYLSD